MIKSILHKIVSNPRVYDAVQTLVGARAIEKRLSIQLDKLKKSGSIIDIGGGTGLMKSIFAEGSLYVCLDIDPVKLAGYIAKDPNGVAVLGDATIVPIRSNSVDLVVCRFLSHHIPHDCVENLFHESFRILKPEGTFVFLDGVKNVNRFRSNFLWRYDRGSYPRRIDEIRTLIEKNGRVILWDEFAFLHQYVLCLARRKEA